LGLKCDRRRQGLKIACIEEMAYRMGFITSGRLPDLSHELRNAYGEYLRDVVDN